MQRLHGWVLLTLLSLLPLVAAAQGEDVAAWYPLHLGDRWQYRVVEGYATFPLWTVEVVAETTTLSGRRYARLHDSRGSDDVYERVDTAGARVMRWDPQTGVEVAVDSLQGSYGDIRWGHRIWDYWYQCDGVSRDTILGVPTFVRVWTGLVIPDTKSYGIGLEFGVVLYDDWYADVGCGGYCGVEVKSVLQYARIDGDEFGTFLGVDDEEGTPAAFHLEQNYPNPFNPTTAIPYQLAAAGSVRLSVFDLLGREVARLVDAWYEPGRHVAEWDATSFTSGIYFCRLEAGGLTRTVKLALVR